MLIPTEPVGCIPRPLALIEAFETTDGDDTSTSRSAALAKIRARELGNAMASVIIGGG